MKTPAAKMMFVGALMLAPLAQAQAIRDFKFEVTTLGGQKLTQDDFKNSVLIVDFWGTWCGPCRKAIPALKELYAKYKHHGLEVVGLCYEKVGKDAALRLVRKFASEHGITYELALGTSKIQRQVTGFGGYPTMLFFKKGLEFSHMEVGYTDAHKRRAEKWVREQLSLGKPAGGEGEESEEEEKDDEEEVDEEEEDEAEEDEKIPAGKIYLPGNHDKGFDFEVDDIDGKKIRFQDLRGRKVILALTSTWDEQAKETAAILNQLHKLYRKDRVVVLAASVELAKAREKKVEAIKRFVDEAAVTYKVFPVSTVFLRKLHLPSGLPTFLMFDERGTLVLRKKSAPKDKILAAFWAAMNPVKKAKSKDKARSRATGLKK